MTATRFVRTLIAIAACSILATPPAQAQTAAPDAGNKPVKLNSSERKPVATSATRTVKKKDGEYAKATVKRRVKVPPAAAAPVSAPLSAAAAQAFAAYELARVRVVTAEETDGARRLADDAIGATRVIAVENVQIVAPSEINHIDRQADSTVAVSLDALSRDLAGSRHLTALYEAEPAGEAKSSADSLLQRALVLFGSMFAGITALIRILLG
jgi:Ni/Co efflux regulator RcnB